MHDRSEGTLYYLSSCFIIFDLPFLLLSSCALPLALLPLSSSSSSPCQVGACANPRRLLGLIHRRCVCGGRDTHATLVWPAALLWDCSWKRTTWSVHRRCCDPRRCFVWSCIRLPDVEGAARSRPSSCPPLLQSRPYLNPCTSPSPSPGPSGSLSPRARAQAGAPPEDGPKAEPWTRAGAPTRTRAQGWEIRAAGVQLSPMDCQRRWCAAACSCCASLPRSRLLPGRPGRNFLAGCQIFSAAPPRPRILYSWSCYRPCAFL